MSFSRLHIFERLKCVLSDVCSAARFNRGIFSPIYNDSAFVQNGVLDPDSCERLMAVINSLIQSGKAQFVDSVSSDHRIFYFERYIPDLLARLDIDNALLDISDYLGSRVKHWFLMANRVDYRPGNVGSGGGFHRDSVYSNQLKIIWYLNDVGIENGPFSFVRGSHKRLFSDASPLKPPHSRCEGIPNGLEPVIGEAGLRLVCNTRCVHGGMPILKGVRYAITLYTFTSTQSYRLMQKKIGC